MRTTRWLALLVGLLACGLIAAGCGDDDSTTSAATSEDTTAAETTSEDTSAEETTSEDGEVADNESIDSEEFYNACTEAAAGTPGEATAETVCGQARDALEECANQAEASGDSAVAEDAIALCQETADQAVEQLESLGG